MPLLRNTDKSKISKRKNPAARLMWFKEQGYLPEAVRNFLQLLGYAGDEETEVSTFEEFVENFSWSKVNTVGPIFDLKKLDWLNGHYIRSLTADELADRILAFETDWQPSPAEADVLRRAVPIIQERLVLLKDARPQLDYLFAADDALTIEDDARAGLAENAADVLDAAIAVAETVPFETDAIQAALRERIVEGMGIKPKFAFAPIRVAVSGRKVSPPLFESMEILGRESTLARLRALRASL
jgi:glutamyl-tRNA synthetase